MPGLVPSDALPPLDGPADDEGFADGIAPGVWDKVKALVDEAQCNAFCLSDKDGADGDENAPWRMRTAVVTLRRVSTLGSYAVQTLAPDPNKLKVRKSLFEALAPADQQMLLERELVTRKVSVIHGRTAPLRFNHSTMPVARSIKLDEDVTAQIAGCQQEEKEAAIALERLKCCIRAAWPHGTKIQVPREGSKHPQNHAKVNLRLPTIANLSSICHT